VQAPPEAPAKATSVPVPADLQGKWIAWDENQETVVAAADTYPELRERVKEMGLLDAMIERAPGIHPADSGMRLGLVEGESPDILRDVRDTIPDAEQWLDTPNTRLRFNRPRDLVGTPQEGRLRYLLRGIWSGITS
jgi:hypothetical protein